MGARAQVITIIKIEECTVIPFFVVHRQWAEGTDMLLEVLDIVSFVYSHRGYFSMEYLQDTYMKKFSKKFHMLNDDVFLTNDLINRFFNAEMWRSFDNDVGFAKLVIDMKKDGAFTGQLQLMNHDFTPITIDMWRDTFSFYDKNNDSDAFYSGFKSLMQWYEIDIS